MASNERTSASEPHPGAPLTTLRDCIIAAPSIDYAVGLLCRAANQPGTHTRERRVIDLWMECGGNREPQAAAQAAARCVVVWLRRRLTGSSVITYARALQAGLFKKYGVDIARIPKWIAVQRGVLRNIGVLPADRPLEALSLQEAWRVSRSWSAPAQLAARIMFFTGTRLSTIRRARQGDLRRLPGNPPHLQFAAVTDKRRSTGTVHLFLIPVLKETSPLLALVAEPNPKLEWSARPYLVARAPKSFPAKARARAVRKAVLNALAQAGVPPLEVAHFARHSLRTFTARYLLGAPPHLARYAAVLAPVLRRGGPNGSP